MLRNFIVALGLVVFFCGYAWISPLVMPSTHALTVIANAVGFPLVIGFLAGYLLTGHLILKFAALLLIPVAQILIFGGDPAKPGLENVLALVELAILWLGCIAAHVLVRKRTRAEAGQAGAS